MTNNIEINYNKRYYENKICVDCNKLKKIRRYEKKCSTCVNKIRQNKKPKTLCQCGCGQQISIIGSDGCIRKFIKGHHAIGENNSSWKGGRRKHNNYWMVWVPTHPFCDSHGYIREHRLIYEKFLSRYLTEKETIHHINGVKDDNRIENLKLYETNSLHIKENHRKNMSDRICLLCNSDKTYTDKKTGYIHWYKYNNGYICGRCKQRKKRS